MQPTKVKLIGWRKFTRVTILGRKVKCLRFSPRSICFDWFTASQSFCCRHPALPSDVLCLHMGFFFAFSFPLQKQENCLLNNNQSVRQSQPTPAAKPKTAQQKRETTFSALHQSHDCDSGPMLMLSFHIVKPHCSTGLFSFFWLKMGGKNNAHMCDMTTA